MFSLSCEDMALKFAAIVYYHFSPAPKSAGEIVSVLFKKNVCHKNDWLQCTYSK